MTRRLVFLIVLAVLLVASLMFVTGCVRDAPAGPPTRQDRLVAILNDKDIDIGEDEDNEKRVGEGASITCADLRDGRMVSDVKRNVEETWNWTPEDAATFVAASVMVFCPDVVDLEG